MDIIDSMMDIHCLRLIYKELQKMILTFTVIFILKATFTNCEINLPKKMKAVGFNQKLPISNENSLLDLVVSLPVIEETDLLIEVKAITVNPADAQLREWLPATEGAARILGWDGAGVVVNKGKNTSKYNIGDEVFFAGDIRRNGSNAEYVAIDEILVGPKPSNLTFEEAAAMPLTSLTAYESIYDRLSISEKDKEKTLLIINSAGGVGSVASQLAKNLGLKVIGTASRPETRNFSLVNGVDIVINHRKDLISQLENNGYGNGVDFILVNYDPFPYWDTLMKAIKPQGKICLIVPSSGSVDIKALLNKSVTLASELLLTKIIYDTDDKSRLQDMLREISKMLDSGKLKSTMTRTLSPINAINLREAHRILENKSMIGKLVLSAF